MCVVCLVHEACALCAWCMKYVRCVLRAWVAVLDCNAVACTEVTSSFMVLLPSISLPCPFHPCPFYVAFCSDPVLSTAPHVLCILCPPYPQCTMFPISSELSRIPRVGDSRIVLCPRGPRREMFREPRGTPYWIPATLTPLLTPPLHACPPSSHL